MVPAIYLLAVHPGFPFLKLDATIKTSPAVACLVKSAQLGESWNLRFSA
jgi:hypothetical protein